VKVAAAVAAVFLMIGASVAGSYALSLYVEHQGQERLCSAFELFVHKPAPPVNTPLKLQQATQYRRLKIFEARVGC